MAPPSLVETIGSTNIVLWDGGYWTVPQGLGPLDLDNDEHRARPGIVRHETIEAARATVAVFPQAPGGIPLNGYSLVELEAQFLRYDLRADGTIYHVPVETLAEAQGVDFLCPLCFAKNGGPIGTHHVTCWSRSRGVPDDASPGPGRWRLDGTSLADLTLNEEPGKSRSVALIGGCAWHGFVTNGRATDA